MLVKRLPIRTLLLFVSASVSFSLYAQQENSRFQTHWFEHRGLKIPYRLFVPSAQSHNKPFPLVLYLHGAGERGNDASNLVLKNGALEFAKRQTTYPCYVLVPQCPKEMKWSPYQKELGYYRLSDTASVIQELLIELVQEIQRRYSVDTSRVYVVGISMGGFGTWELVMRYPSRFAAAIPICGGGDETKAERLRTVPVWVFHGAKDQIIPVRWSRTLVEALRTIDAPVKYTELPDAGHDVWSTAFNMEELYDWLFSQKKP